MLLLTRKKDTYKLAELHTTGIPYIAIIKKLTHSTKVIRS